MSGAAGDDRSRLVRALALSRRFHLYLAHVESPRAADQFVKSLGEQLHELGRAEASIVRLDPYAGRLTDGPLEDAELADRVLVPLLDPPAHLREAIQIIDVSRARYADSDAWSRVFSLWNEKRNVLGADRGEVLVLLPHALEAVLAKAAPDVWSVRSGDYVVEEDAARSGLAAGEAPGAPLLGVKLLVGAAPPLSLFGGDAVVQPWVSGVLVNRRISEVAEPQSSLKQDGRQLEAQRERRFAEALLGERRFREAESHFSELLEHVEHDAELSARVLSGLSFALVAQDRAWEAADHCERALRLLSEVRVSSQVTPQVFQVSALTYWCLGHLDHAERLDGTLGGQGARKTARTLRLVERGRVDDARREVSNPLDLVRADLEILAGGFEESLRVFEHAGHEYRSMRALVEIARGNDDRAAHLLLLPSYQGSGAELRPAACHAYASGILSATRGDRADAATWFGHAHGFITQWGRYGLDRRSRLRAEAMVNLCLTQIHLDGDRALEMARALAAQTEVLLGDTGEDCVARAIAVLAHGELARRLALIRSADAPGAARRALALAQPFADLGAPGWTAVLRDAERRSAEIERAHTPR
jgi:tetratricopeptide (TPR) repeat protein